MKKSYEMDMCNGAIFPKVISFAFPLILSGVLQLLFNAADVIVVGRFAGSRSLAAVGSTTSLVNFLINIFMGLSIGANVMVARYYGAKNEKDLSETIHTAIALSLVSGAVLVFLGFFASGFCLTLMGTPEDVIDKSILYMKIYFAGMPVVMLYNFGSAILRAIGDTRRPLYFLTLAGVVNVILNLYFVTQLHLDVAGVALATVLSQCISAALVLRCLMKSEGALKLELKKLRLNRRKLGLILRVGLPAGIQGSIFSISNVLIQSSVNSFGSIAMAGNTAAQNIEGFTYTAMNALYQTNLSFTSQNVGAKKYERIDRILLCCQASVIAVSLGMCIPVLLNGQRLIGVYSTDPEVISYGYLRLKMFCLTYPICGIMDTMVGSMRGLGYSMLPTLVSLTGACGFRVLWIFTVFQVYRSLPVLYASYPISWTITGIVHIICYLRVRKKLLYHASRTAA